MTKTVAAWVVAVFLLVPGLAEAQRVSLGFRGGLTRTDVSLEGADDDVEFDARTGIVLGGFVQFPVGENLGIQAGLNYTQKGGELTDEEGTGELELDYFEIPVLGVFEIPSSGPLSGRLMGGPVLSFESSCEVSGEDQGVSVSADCESIEIETNSVDFGIQIGGGLLYHIQDVASLFFDVGYNIGLTNLDANADGDESAKNRALMFSVGVDFPVGG